MKRKRNRSRTQIFKMTIIEKMRHEKYEGDENDEVNDDSENVEDNEQ